MPPCLMVGRVFAHVGFRPCLRGVLLGFELVVSVIVGRTRRVAGALAVAGLSILAAPLWAGDCASLNNLALPHITITRAEEVESGSFTPDSGKPLADLPGFCRVTAVAKPSPDSNILIEIWMPQSGWNQRLEGTGNGGFAGKISWGALAEGLQRGYAVANTDMGMATPAGATAAVFINRPERWADWGYRATHEMTVVARQVVHAYYTQPPSHAYFVGCSTGGEQALMEAQRFPDDYDGIVGGAPAQNRTGFTSASFGTMRWRSDPLRPGCLQTHAPCWNTPCCRPAMDLTA